MTKKPQVGEWWIDSDGDVGQVVFISPQADPLYLVVYRSMSTDNPPDFFECWQSATDLDQHVPQCTGWDWKPEIWRKAKPSDVSQQGRRARFRDVAGQSWKGGILIGCRWSPDHLCWLDPDTTYGWRQCEVLDDGY